MEEGRVGTGDGRGKGGDRRWKREGWGQVMGEGRVETGD